MSSSNDRTEVATTVISGSSHMISASGSENL
jgi:hypothetical protein